MPGVCRTEDAAHLEQILGKKGDLVEASFQHITETVEIDLTQLLALKCQCCCSEGCAQFVGHHSQEPFLRLQAVDQCFILLPQYK